MTEKKRGRGAPKKRGRCVMQKNWKVWKVERSNTSIEETLKKYPYEFIKIYTEYEGIVYIPKGVNPDHIYLGTGDKSDWRYSKVMASTICQRITEGKTLFAICRDEGMPPYVTVRNWAQKNPEFMDALNQAVKDRGEYFRDQAIKTAKDAKEETAQSDKLRVETLKWSASVDNPDKYGKKHKPRNEERSPASFVVNTGIKRNETE